MLENTFLLNSGSYPQNSVDKLVVEMVGILNKKTFKFLEVDMIFKGYIPFAAKTPSLIRWRL